MTIAKFAALLLNESTHWRFTERVGHGVAIRSLDVRWALLRASGRQPSWLARILSRAGKKR